MDLVQSYDIYGSHLPAFDAGFLHFERIEEQLPFHGWHARAHRHERLDQFLFFTEGSGRLLLEGQEVEFQAPVLMVMPAGVVHGFVFSQNVRAPIITVAESFLQAALLGLDSSFTALLAQPHVIDLRQEGRRYAEVKSAFDMVAMEYPEAAPGRQAVMRAALHLLLTAVARAQSIAPKTEEHVLFAAFLRALERDFRKQPGVDYFADALGISAARLSQICRQLGKSSPQALLHERLNTEAKRMLLYTSHSATTISYMLGFREPAYFSRFFKRMTGTPPGAFRDGLKSDGV